MWTTTDIEEAGFELRREDTLLRSKFNKGDLARCMSEDQQIAEGSRTRGTIVGRQPQDVLAVSTDPFLLDKYSTRWFSGKLRQFMKCIHAISSSGPAGTDAKLRSVEDWPVFVSLK